MSNVDRPVFLSSYKEKVELDDAPKLEERAPVHRQYEVEYHAFYGLPYYWAGVHNNLGVVLENRGRLEEAIDHYQEALRLDPNYAKARNNLERALRLVDNSAEISRTTEKQRAHEYNSQQTVV